MARTAKIETLQSNDGSYDIYPRTVVEALVHKDGSPTQIAETDETGKIAPEYLPEMDYVPNAEKGAANGVATLDDAGRVLSTQLPPMDYDPSGSAESVQEALDAHAGVKVLSSSGVHGFRYNASTTEFEVYNDETGAWESVETGGGGIAPLDVSEISTDYNNGRLYIKWSDPEDTTISGIVVCKWAGTKVVRKAGGYPTSVKDGVLVVDNQVRDQYKDTAFCDSGLANGTTYYYQFFPYSSEGNVNGNTTNRTTGVPNRLTIDSIPVQSGVLTYNKGTQTPSWTGYDPVKMTLSGVTSGTNAGSYVAIFTPTEDYRWADLTTEPKQVSWSIAKADDVISVSPDSLTLNASNLSGAITVTKAGTGAISAVSSDTNIVTVSVDGNVITVNSVDGNTGTATVAISASGDDNYNAPPNKQYTVKAEFVLPTLNDNSWNMIRAVSDAGDGANYWSIGDRKAVTLNGTMSKLTLSNFTTYAFILGFNHNASVEGSNRIHFQIGKTALTGGTDVCLISGYSNDSDFYMNTSNTNSGGWNNSYMRKTILGTSLSSYSGTFIGVLPAALRAVLKTVTKYTDNTGNSTAASAVTATTDYAFLLSEFEVFGSTTYANSNEKSKQAQYDYYKAGNSKIKYKHNDTGSAVGWRLRSPNASNSTNFVIVSTDGNVNGNYASNSFGVAPGFCV